MTRENIFVILIAILATYQFINQSFAAFDLMLTRIKKKNSRKVAVEAFAAQFGVTIAEADKLVITES